MRKIITLISLILIGKFAIAQDVSVIAITAPVSGCSLSATSSVTINVKNVGLTDLSGVPFDLSYTINAGVPVTDVGVSFPFFASNTTVSYTFLTTADLSIPASYTFTSFSTLATDINTTNDAVTGYVVTSTAPSVGGTVSGGANICKGSNSGTLTLSAQTGTVNNWEYSTDGGTTWISISNTTTTQSYFNLTVSTKYRAQVQNGTCAIATSSIATMVIDPVTVAGAVSGSATVCSGSNGATMTSTGRTGIILKWQFSTDGGLTWTDIANTTTTQAYLNLTTTTRYRTQVRSGSCNPLFSTPAIINVNPVSVGGNVTGGTGVCSGSNAGSLTLTGQTGAVTRWEFSTNAGSTWTNIVNTTTSQNYLNLTGTRYYRAFVTSGGCAGTYSTIDSIVVDPPSIGGTLDSNASVCSGINAGILLLTGYTGTIQNWEFSTDGGITYIPLADSTDTLSYLNLDTTTIYRVNIKSGGCPSVNSTTATITVNPFSVGGFTTMNDTVCSGSNGASITLNGQTGSVTNWQSSTDGITWTPIANTTALQAYTDITATTYYQAVVTSSGCMADSSSIDTITVDLPSVGGAISASANVCDGSNSGTITLGGQTGNVIRWENSIDGGINWVIINDTTTSYTYTNINITTIYRSIVQNGTCSTAISETATLTVIPASSGGTVNGSATACSGSNSGSLNLVGYVGTVQRWESSTDGGITWDTISNTTPIENYLNVLTTTMYRAIVGNGICADDTSAVATITIDSASVGGVLSMDDTVCISSNLGTLTLAGQTGAIQNWELSTDGGFTWLTISNTTDSQTYVNLSTTTLYRVNVKNGVCNGATSNAVTINVKSVPSAAITSSAGSSLCSGDSTILSVAAGDYNYLWSNLDSTQSITVNSPGTYGVIVVDTITGCMAMDSTTITVHTLPSVFAGNDTTLTLGNSLNLMGSGVGIVNWSWSPSIGLSNTSIANPMANPIVNTTYTLIGTDANGCSDSDTMMITIITVNGSDVIVSNLMTPNGDGHNDKWIVQNIDNHPNTEAVILNREGQEVFRSESYDNSWDGTNGGNKLPDGTYYYILKFPDNGTDKEMIFKGSITILNEASK